MNKQLENICRVCITHIGSRNIFEKSPTTNDSQFSIPAIGENVSSLDRLVEKLRYVTMLKVSGHFSFYPAFIHNFVVLFCLDHTFSIHISLMGEKKHCFGRFHFVYLR